MINKVTLLGNLTRDVETLSGAQTTVARLRLATHTSWRDGNGEWQRRPEFHSLVAFGDLAERCSLRATKGRRVYVEGHLRTRDWTGTDGLRRTSTDVVVDSVRYLDAPDGAEGLDTADEAAVEPGPGSLATPSTATVARKVRARGASRRRAAVTPGAGEPASLPAGTDDGPAAPFELHLAGEPVAGAPAEMDGLPATAL
ncbi:MAG TPA: single-stranded DNA-binding protein [Candidatus Dormibacteraeota bacterium]|nr:single-stranded DNA-binding protein [Candidatus Dormibacteraeota bacterium]